jgi:Na+-driven multidrug efflux pump
VLALVAVLNIPLSWGFFHGVGGLPGMGFPGIALGTAISHTIGGLLVLVVLFRGRAGLAIRRHMLWPNAPLLRRILRISVPAGIDSLSVSAGHMWFLSIINALGDVASGAHGIAIYWESLGYLSGAAFQTAAITLVGQNLGAGKPREAARSAWTALALGAAVMTFMGAVFFILARPMFQLFCPDPAQAPLVEAGVPVLRLVAFAMPGLAAAIVLTGALRGAGDVRVPLLITWIGFLCIRIPLAYALTRPGVGLGLLGAWLAMLIDIWVRGLIIVWRFAVGRWQSMHV